MKIRMIAATLVFAAAAFAQDKSMPGMNMPAQPKPKTPPAHRHPVPTKKPKASVQKGDQAMPGMDMGQHDSSIPGMKMGGQGKQQNQSMPGMKMDPPAGQQDQSMPGMDMSQHGAQSGQPPKGTDMKNMQGMHMDGPMTQAPQNGSITHDTMNLQEPENPSP